MPRYTQPECVHGAPGGTPASCALCRHAQPRQVAPVPRAQPHQQLALWPDVKRLAAGDRD
jgi:hypothetical protein